MFKKKYICGSREIEGDDKMNFNIAVIKGDGIGPEIVNEAIKVSG